MKSNSALYILISISILVLVFAAYRVNNSMNNAKELNSQLNAAQDSLENLGMQYEEIYAQYEDIRQELDRTKGKLIYVKNQLDTMTSRRMTTFTEVQTRLIELKLSLGKIETIAKDSTQFRFE